MQHDEIKELFAPYLDGMLSVKEIIVVEEHLNNCSQCKKEIEDIRTTLKLMRDLPDEVPPFDIATRVKGELLATQKNKWHKFVNLRVLGIAASFILVMAISLLGSQINLGTSVKEAPSQQQSQNIAFENRTMDMDTSGANKSASLKAKNEIYAPQEQKRALAKSVEQVNPTESAKMLYDANAAKTAAPATVEPKVIKNADLELKVKKYNDFKDVLDNYLANDTGYIENSSLNKNSVTNKYSGSLIVRVKQEKFQGLLELLKQSGDLQRVNINSSDVTTQYIDTDARIKALEQQIKALQGLLEKAKNVNEMLSIEKELTRVNGEHDSLVSQNRYLDRQVAYSTITVFMYEEELPTDIIGSNPDTGILTKAKQGFITSINSIIKGAQQMFIQLVTILPQVFIVLLVILFFVIIIKIKKRQ